MATMDDLGRTLQLGYRVASTQARKELLIVDVKWFRCVEDFLINDIPECRGTLQEAKIWEVRGTCVRLAHRFVDHIRSSIIRVYLFTACDRTLVLDKIITFFFVALS